ncbi:phage regulatory CII family protein [uncultured Azohydromonas sp.]|jgi:Phage regulatory protein CII (CP76).|uniref:phage regulatory CII family protein n=1 Tax=uncultured Azohydromonas sp. TaxID=487342 RepID=UPI002630A08D|nr:phage regulatory CII family protein [uncultured Azohydromonas sp.]
MDINDAPRYLARKYPGGAAALAFRMGMSSSTLQHQLDPNCPGHKLGWDTAVEMSVLADDPVMLNAFAAALRRMTLPLPDVSLAGECVLQGVAQVTRELGDYLAHVSEALADGQVSDNELRHCERELGQLIAAGQHLQALLHARNQAAKPAHERRQTVRRAADRGPR